MKRDNCRRRRRRRRKTKEEAEEEEMKTMTSHIEYSICSASVTLINAKQLSTVRNCNQSER